jgi:two-component system nitrogen regulation sensor histidine kinase NtrY
MISDRISPGNYLYYLLVLVLLSAVATGIFLIKAWYISSFLMLFISLIASFLLIRFHNQTNRSVAAFFDSLRNDDTAMQFPGRFNSRALNTLHESMNRLNRHFQEIKLQNESNENYYRTLIHHSATGLMVLNQDNEIELMNEIACRYAGISPETTHYKVLATKNPEFHKAVCILAPGENVTYKNILNNSFQLLFFRATLIRRKDRPVKMVSIQDIRQELESREVESYRKLISVLTHEIMNLLSPVTSVAKALFSRYFRNDQPIKLAEVDENTIMTTVNSLKVIEEQSRGMINFVNNYRKISKIPSPVIETFFVTEWVDQLKIVFKGELESESIDFDLNADRTVEQIVADKKLINQVIINLMNNAIDAVNENKGEKKISIHIMRNSQNRILIKISNNGPYIPPELQEKIFVPFFTTKKNGSGIGLSISQEIMKLHKGSIQVFSEPESHTVFILEI